MTMRRARVEDAAALARFAERTFRDAFVAQNDPADIDLHCKEHFNRKAQEVELLDPNVVTIVAEPDGDLAGYAQVRLFSPKDCVRAARPAELCRLYVSKERQGRGLAHEFMSEILTAARTAGTDGIWLSVWEHNPRAIAFYRKYAFEMSGEHVFLVGTDPQRDFVMSLDLRD